MPSPHSEQRPRHSVLSQLEGRRRCLKPDRGQPGLPDGQLVEPCCTLFTRIFVTTALRDSSFRLNFVRV